jgi:hypothetical protein
MRFVLGLIVGIALGAGGLYVAQRVLRDEPAETASPTADAGPDRAQAQAKSAGRKKRRGTGGAAGSAEAPPDEPIPVLTDADRAMRAEGDSLTARAAALDLSDEREPRDLEQGEIDAAFAPRVDAIVGCITGARGAAPLTGRIDAGVVVSAGGRVVKSRVEAPAWLISRGLGRCVRRELAALRFPATGKEHVVTVPFDLD